MAIGVRVLNVPSPIVQTMMIILFIIVCAVLNSRTACENFCDIGFAVVFRALRILSVLLRLQTQ